MFSPSGQGGRLPGPGCELLGATSRVLVSDCAVLHACLSVLTAAVLCEPTMTLAEAVWGRRRTCYNLTSTAAQREWPK